MCKDKEKNEKVVTKTEIVTSDMLSPFYPRFKDLKMDPYYSQEPLQLNLASLDLQG